MSETSTIGKIRAMSDKELDQHISTGAPALTPEWQIAVYEQQRRKQDQLLKTHWTVIPNFWLTAISAVAAIIAAVLAWLAI